MQNDHEFLLQMAEAAKDGTITEGQIKRCIKISTDTFDQLVIIDETSLDSCLAITKGFIELADSAGLKAESEQLLDLYNKLSSLRESSRAGTIIRNINDLWLKIINKTATQADEDEFLETAYAGLEALAKLTPKQIIRIFPDTNIEGIGIKERWKAQKLIDSMEDKPIGVEQVFQFIEGYKLNTCLNFYGETCKALINSVYDSSIRWKLSRVKIALLTKYRIGKNWLIKNE